MNAPTLYSKYNDKQKSDNIYVIENYLKFINWKKEKSRILDVGCGDGFVTVEILWPKIVEKSEKIVGCDLSEKMVKFATDKYESSQVEFVQLDIATESLCSSFHDQFNHIFSFYCLHWVQNQRLAFSNMYKMLKPGGNMLLTFLAHHPIFNIYENMANNIKWSTYVPKDLISPYHYSKKPKEMIEKILKETGFSTKLCQLEKRKFVYPNMDVLKKSIVAVNPKLSQLSNSELSDYLEDYFVEVRKQKHVQFVPYDNNNEESVHVEYNIFVVYACKPVI